MEKKSEPMFAINPYIQFLDSVIAECGPVACLTSASNAVTRRAKSTYVAERDALLRLVAREGITGFSEEVYDAAWKKLCKKMKYGVLRHDYAQPKGGAHDMRYPHDGRVVPGYAKDALAQLRTLTACVIAVRDKAV